MENIEFKANAEKPSKVSFLQKIPSKIKSPKILIYALLLVSLPTSVLLVKTVQDIRQRASGFPATPPVPMTYVFNQSAKLMSDPIPHYFVIPSSPSFDLTKDITLEAWIKPDSSNLNTQNNQTSDIITRHDGDGNAYGLQYTSRKETDGTYSYSYNFSIADKKINCAQVTLYTANLQSQIGYHVDEATLTKWKHVAAVKSGNILYVFENGKLVASRTDWVFQSVCTQDNPISIGARLTGNGQFQDSFFYGEIDEARISNIARYTTDFPIQPEPFKSDSSTVALYHFDKNIDDASGNGLYGKAYGSIQYPDSTIKTVLALTPTPTPVISMCGSPCSSSSQCAGTCSLCSNGVCTPQMTPAPGTPTPVACPTAPPCLGPIAIGDPAPNSPNQCPQYYCSDPPTPTPQIGMPIPCGQFGDIDGNYMITSSDQKAILEIVAGLPYKDWQIKNADVDGDGKPTASDALIVGRYLAGLETTFPVCKPKTTPTPGITYYPTPSPALYPDLTIDTANGGGLSTSWQVGSLNNPVNVKFRIINQGSVPASAQYIYTNQSEGFSTLAPDNTCTASTILGPGKTCVSSYNFVFKSYGTKYFTISIDPYNQIKESVESNNIFDTKVLLFQMSPTPAYGTPPVTPKPSLQPTPTPAPKMCPASLSTIKYLDSCRYLFFSKGARNITYTCNDKYTGRMSFKSCTSLSELNKQAAAACAKRKTYCTNQ